MIVDGYVTMRELIRHPARWFKEVEWNGKVVAISRRGRLVAILAPFPERITFELGDRVPTRREEPAATQEQELEFEKIDIDETARQFLRDALADVPLWWEPPDRESMTRYAVACMDLQIAKLMTHRFGRYTLTPTGRAMAAWLTSRQPSARAPG